MSRFTQKEEKYETNMQNMEISFAVNYEHHHAHWLHRMCGIIFERNEKSGGTALKGWF